MCHFCIIMLVIISWVWSHLIGDFFPRLDSLASIGAVWRIGIPEEPSRAIRADQLQYCLLPPLRHDVRIVPRLTTDSNGGGPDRLLFSQTCASNCHDGACNICAISCKMALHVCTLMCRLWCADYVGTRWRSGESSIFGAAESAARTS